MNNPSRHLGQFEVRADLIIERFDEVQEIFSQLKIVVIRAESMIERNTIKYVAISEYFEEIDKYMIPAKYNIKVTKDIEGHIVDVKVKKIKEGKEIPELMRGIE